jgi:osmoprotectant transport system permease protein
VEETLMEFIGDVVAWLGDPAHWRGTQGVPARLVEHVQLSALAVACASVAAVPAGILLGHLRRGGVLAVALVNIGRAVPSFAIVALALPVSISLGLGLGFWPTFLALFALALPPLFTNSYTAVRDVPADIVEAARGMGMRGVQVLAGVELPLALPVIVAAARVATVQVVATATLGALVAWGGLGRFIIDGLAQRDFAEVFAGAMLVAVLAVAVELGFALAERVLPVGIRRAGGFLRPV